MATIDDLLKALEANENGEELAEVVKGLQQEINKKNSEAKNLRERFKTSEANAGSLKDKFDKLVAREGIEIGEDDDFDALLEAHFAKKTEPETPNGDDVASKELAALRSEMAKLSRDLEKQKTAAEESAKIAKAEKERRIKTERDRQIVDALTNGKAIKPQMLAKVFAERVKMLDDESLVYIGENDAELTLEEGVNQFLKDNPEFAANSQRAGSGSGSGSGKGTPIYTREQIEAMSSEQINELFDKGVLQDSLKALTAK